MMHMNIIPSKLAVDELKRKTAYPARAAVMLYAFSPRKCTALIQIDHNGKHHPFAQRLVFRNIFRNIVRVKIKQRILIKLRLLNSSD